MHMSDPFRAVWRKSTYSGGNGDCLEVARMADAIGLRDSKNPAGGYLSVAPEVFGALIASIKHEREPAR